MTVNDLIPEKYHKLILKAYSNALIKFVAVKFENTTMSCTTKRTDSSLRRDIIFHELEEVLIPTGKVRLRKQKGGFDLFFFSETSLNMRVKKIDSRFKVSYSNTNQSRLFEQQALFGDEIHVTLGYQYDFKSNYSGLYVIQHRPDGDLVYPLPKETSNKHQLAETKNNASDFQTIELKNSKEAQVKKNVS